MNIIKRYFVDLNYYSKFKLYQVRNLFLTHLFILIGITLWISSPLMITYGFFNYYFLIINIFCYLLSLKISQFPIYTKYIKSCIKYNLIFNSFATICEDPIDFENCKNMFCYHPHGIFAISMQNIAFSFESPLSQLKYKINILISEILLYFNQLLLFLKFIYGDNVNSVKKNIMTKLMSKSKNIMLLPGGFEEASLSYPGIHNIFIKKRLGFIKLALLNGYTIYPIYCFGENDLYYNLFYYTIPNKFKFWLNYYKIPCVLPFGNFFLPRYNVDLLVVVGKKIKCPIFEESHISEELLLEYQTLYINEIKRIFIKYRSQAGYPNSKLNIF